MDNQRQQRFCTNCGQALTPGTAFCVACGAPTGTPSVNVAGQFSSGVQPGYAPPSMQSPVQSQDDLLMAALAAGIAANQAKQNSQQGKKSRSRLTGFGCLLLMLVVLGGPFVGLALTTGRLRVIFTFVVLGLVLFFFLFVLLANLTTRRGREELKEGAAEGCLDAIFGIFLGGG